MKPRNSIHCAANVKPTCFGKLKNKMSDLTLGINYKKNWEHCCDCNIIHFFFTQLYMEIFWGGVMHASAVITWLTNQISLTEKKSNAWVNYVLLHLDPNKEYSLPLVLRWQASGVNEGKYKWNIIRQYLKKNECRDHTIECAQYFCPISVYTCALLSNNCAC